MVLFSTKVAGVIALVSHVRDGLALLEALDKGINFGLGKGGRQCLGVLGVCRRRPLAHTLGFLVLSFGKVTDVAVGKSFAAEVGGSSSMLHKSILPEFIFQSSLHGGKGVAVHLILSMRRKAERMLKHSWWSQMPAVVRT